MTLVTMIKKNDWLRAGTIRLCRVHFVLVAVYVAYIIASDATHLITPDVVLQRWTMTTVLLIVLAVVWALAKRTVNMSNYYRLLIYTLITLDILVAGFSVYSQRGMASRAVMLFAVPMVTSAILQSRSALFMTATLSVAAYALAAVKYFVDYFNEGYKAELYIEVGLYCAVLFVMAGVLSILVSSKNQSSKN